MKKFYFNSILLALLVSCGSKSNYSDQGLIGDKSNIQEPSEQTLVLEQSDESDPKYNINLDIRVLLQGPFKVQSQLMETRLIEKNLLPISEPYTELGYIFQGGGSEIVSDSVFLQSSQDAVIDWIIVEIRDLLAPENILFSRSALLLADGRVVETDGTSSIEITDISAKNFYVAVRHRNHLGAMIKSVVASEESDSLRLINFINPCPEDLYGSNALLNLGDRHVLWGGDANFDQKMKYTGADNDRDVVFSTIGGIVPTFVFHGYHLADFNLDGEVKYTGADNDRDIISFNLHTLFGVPFVPTNFILAQLPGISL